MALYTLDLQAIATNTTSQVGLWAYPLTTVNTVLDMSRVEVLALPQRTELSTAEAADVAFGCPECPSLLTIQDESSAPPEMGMEVMVTKDNQLPDEYISIL